VPADGWRPDGAVAPVDGRLLGESKDPPGPGGGGSGCSFSSPAGGPELVALLAALGLALLAARRR
jgi:MYXO-CTERM domain-containing protein